MVFFFASSSYTPPQTRNLVVRQPTPPPTRIYAFHLPSNIFCTVQQMSVACLYFENKRNETKRLKNRVNIVYANGILNHMHWATCMHLARPKYQEKKVIHSYGKSNFVQLVGRSIIRLANEQKDTHTAI